MPQPAPRFVILRHALGDAVHWDLMLETADALTTWQLLDDPHRLASPDEHAAIPACRIGDHRKDYLDYEGPLTRNRGHVTRLDRGTYEPIDIQPHGWTVRFTGSLLNGTFHLEKLTAPDDAWRCQRLG